MRLTSEVSPSNTMKKHIALLSLSLFIASQLLPEAAASQRSASSITKPIQEKMVKLSTAEQVKEWMSLIPRLWTESETEGLSLSHLISCLPPPVAWPDLIREIKARPVLQENAFHDYTLRMVADWLAQDIDGLKADYAEYCKSEPRAGFHSKDIEKFILNSSSDPAFIESFLEQRISNMEKKPGSSHVYLPDLVTLLGNDKAKAFLRRVVVLPNLRLEVDGDETTALARSVALDRAADLKAPLWKLCLSLDSISLFEKLDKKFPVTDRQTGSDYDRKRAEIYYFFGLISLGRNQDAMGLVKKHSMDNSSYLTRDAVESMDRAGYSKALQSFFHDLLAQNPDQPWWSEYISLSTRMGKQSEMLALARESANRKNLKPNVRIKVMENLALALLAADKLDEAGRVIEDFLKIDPPPPEKTSDQNMPVVLHEPSELNIKIVRLGILLNKKDWLEKGIQRCVKNNNDIHELVHLLLKNNRSNQAEQIIQDSLKAKTAPKEESDGYHFSSYNEAKDELVELAGVYTYEGKYDEVLALLKESEHWGVKDLNEIYMDEDYRDVPLGYMVSLALAKTGRKDEVKKILDAVLNRKGGFDPAYQLLLDLELEDKVLAKLDQLFQADQFEERPLIWKAQILLKQGKLDQAEEAARQAIRIDPSDGEEGKGDRMRVYSVLSEIRKAKGDEKEATFFANVVKSIRAAEDADDYYHAGLLTQGIQKYEDALKFFSDAYCIQSRLAIQLADSGHPEEAEAHYRKAYELMPDSFGRMESHCFGCEGAFRGPKAQMIAEEIFTRLVQKSPEKPQVHYLLGYLKQVQKKYREALPSYQTAVKLDPEYLNAWKKLLDLHDHIAFESKDADQMAFNLIRLDPQNRHGGVEVSKVHDIKGLWNQVESSLAKVLPQPTELYPLPSSAKKLEQSKKEDASPVFTFIESYSQSRFTNIGYPAEVLAGHSVVRELDSAIRFKAMEEKFTKKDYMKRFLDKKK